MADDLGYGRRLSGEEYDSRVVEIHRQASPMPSKEEDAEIRRREFNLSIDYRLGVDFPLHKREALWEIMQQVEKRRLWLGFKHGLRLLLFRDSVPEKLRQGTDAMAAVMVKEFSSVLNEQELRSFFESEQEE